MAEKNLDVRILSRIDSLANWEAKNPRIKLGEICIAVVDETDEMTGKVTRSFKMKIGDGAHDWEDLPYVYYTIPEIEELMVQDGATATKVKFQNDNFTAKNVAAALVELYGKILGVETSVKELNDEAYEIKYSSIKSGLTDLVNVQQALDYITDYLVAYEVDAKDVKYDNAVSNLTDSATGVNLTNVQAALDAIYKLIPLNAAGLSYFNAASHLTSTTVQGAIDELDGRLDSSELASGIKFDTTNTTSKLTKTNVQDVLEELLQYVDDLEGSDIAFIDTKDGVQNRFVQGTEVQEALEKVEDALVTFYDYGVSKDLKSFTFDNTKTQIQADDSDATIYPTLNAQQVMEYVINKFTLIKQNLAGAVSVTFDNTNTDVITGIDVQAALEQLDTKVKDNGNRLDDLDAADIAYDGTIAGSASTTVEQELQSLDSRLDTIEAWESKDIKYDDSISNLGTTTTPINTVQKAIQELDRLVDLLKKATGMEYDDTISQMGTSAAPINTVQKAIEKLDDRLDKSEKANGVSYNDTLYSIGKTNVQDALDNTIGRVKDTEDLVADWDDDTLSKFSTNSDGDLMFGTIKIGGTDDTFHKYASEISYDNTISNMTATDVQAAIDEIDATLDTLVLDADNINYDNIASGLTATDVQDAVDELDQRLDDLNASQVKYGTSSDIKTELDKILAWDADDIPFTDTTTGLGDATAPVDTVQKAIAALDKRLDDADANKNSAGDISYDDTTSQLGTGIDNVQKAIEAIDSKVDTLELKAEKITYDDTTSAMSLGASPTVQKAIEKVDNRLDAIEGWDADDIKYGTSNVKVALDKVYTFEDADKIKYTTLDTDTNKLTSTNVRDALDEVNNKLDTIADNKNTAKDISYNKTETSKSVNAENVQDAIDVLAAAISTTDGKISNDAVDITYDNTSSGMTATNVQSAIDELKADFGTIELKAEKVTFDTTTNNLTSTDTQKAIEEVNSKLDTIAANKNTAGDIIFDNSTNGFVANNLQAAIEEVQGNAITNADDLDFSPVADSTVTDTIAGDAIRTLIARTDTIPTELSELSYDNTKKNLLKATDGQTAIDELAKGMSEMLDGTTPLPYDPTYATLVSTTIQDAIDELDTKYQMYTGAKAAYVEYDPTSSGRTQNKTVQGAIDKAFAEIDQIAAVVPFEIISFTVDGYTMDENRTIYLPSDTTINTLTFRWSTNKDCATITLTGCTPNITDTSAVYNVPFNTDKNIDLIVKDNNGSIATETIKFKFINKIYFGSAAEPATYDDVFVKGLSGFSIDSTTDYKAAMTVAATQYGYIALDTAVADDEFLVNSMDVTLKNCGTVVIDTTVYNVYRTNQSGLGRITIQSL